MADAPKLNSATDATAGKYAPLSWLAVLSLVVAVVFVVVLLAVGWLSYKAGQPLLERWLFIFPAVGIFLAFIARRQIRNAEGAATGEGFANAGWWICVVVGACYFAFLTATEWAIRSEAERVTVQWAEKFGQGNPDDALDTAVRDAFAKTLDPGSPVAGNTQAMYVPQNALPYTSFRSSPLVVVWARNRDTAQFVPNGLKEWNLSPDGKLTCTVAATLKCAEGEFPVTVPLQGTTDPNNRAAGRTWQVLPSPRAGYLELDTAPRTKYGWLVAALDYRAQEAVGRLCDTLRLPEPFGPSLAADGFVSGRHDAAFTEAMSKGLDERVTLIGPTCLIVGPTEPPDTFFARGDGKPMTDDEFKRPDGATVRGGLTSLREVWQSPTATKFHLTYSQKAGWRPAEMAPRHGLVVLSDPTQAVFKVAVDFQPKGPLRNDFAGRGLFTTGRVVVACDDLAVMKDLADALAEAKAGRAPLIKDPPDDVQNRKFRFRVLRIESDLLPVAGVEMKSGGAGGGMGGP